MGNESVYDVAVMDNRRRIESAQTVVEARLAADGEITKVLSVSATASVYPAETLNGERHMPLMREVFAGLGVDRFEVRYVSDEARDARSGLEQLKKDFSDYPIEIK